MFDDLGASTNGNEKLITHTTKHLINSSKGKLIFTAPTEAKEEEKSTQMSAESDDKTADETMTQSESHARELESQAKHVRDNGNTRALALKKQAENKRRRVEKLRKLQAHL